MKLSGNMSKQLVQQLNGQANDEAIQLRWFSELFCVKTFCSSLFFHESPFFNILNFYAYFRSKRESVLIKWPSQ